jgi:hypothetical protein
MQKLLNEIAGLDEKAFKVMKLVFGEVLGLWGAVYLECDA